MRTSEQRADREPPNAMNIAVCMCHCVCMSVQCVFCLCVSKLHGSIALYLSYQNKVIAEKVLRELAFMGHRYPSGVCMEATESSKCVDTVHRG